MGRKMMGEADSMVPVQSLAATNMSMDGADIWTDAVVKTGVTAGSDQLVVDMAWDLASTAIENVEPIKNRVEKAEMVSYLVGFFDRNNAILQSNSATILEDNINLDRIEAQTLQLSPAPLVDGENYQIETREDVAGHTETEMAVEHGLDVVSIQMNSNTFIDILNSMFVTDNNTSSIHIRKQSYSKTSRKALTFSPSLSKSRTFPYKARSFPLSFQARRSVPTANYPHPLHRKPPWP